MGRWLYFTLFIIILTGSGLYAQEDKGDSVIDAWYRDNPRSLPYRDIKNDLVVIIKNAVRALIPRELFIELLDEAVSRGIPGQQIIDAMRKRLNNLIEIKALLDSLHKCLSQGTEGEDYALRSLLKKYSLFMQRGVPLPVLKVILEETCRQGRNYDTAMHALRAIAQIPTLSEFGDEDLISLGKAMISSTLSPSSYSALSSFYIKGKLKNLGIEEITHIIIDALDEGKGLIRIEQEINRRGGQ